MSDSNQRKLGAILSYVSIIVSTLVQLLYTPLLITKLGQSEYGLYSLIASVIGYLTVLDLGFGNAIVVYTSKYRAREEYEAEKKLHGMFRLIFRIIGVIAFLIGLVLYFNVNRLFGSTMTSTELSEAKIMMLILAFNLAITFNFSIYSSILSAYEKFTYQKVMSILNTMLKPLLMIPLLFMGYKAIAMTVVITIVNIIVLLSNYLYCRNKLNIRIKFKGFDKKLFKVILAYSIWIFLGVIVDKVNWSVDQFVLGAVSGTVAVSVYSTANTINTLFINLSSGVSSVLLPKMSKMVAKDASNEEITREFIKVGRIQYYIVFFMCSGLIMFGKEFFIAWVGTKFIKSYYIAIILIVPLCIPLIQNLGLSIMQAKNMHRFRSLLLVFIAVANIFISIPLAKMYQGIGSAIGTSLSLIVGNIIIINIYYYRKVGINVIKFWKNIFKMTIPFVVPVLAMIGIMKFVTLHGYIHVIVFVGIYSFIYFLVSYLFVMNKYEKNIVNKVLNKVFKKKSVNRVDNNIDMEIPVLDKDMVLNEFSNNKLLSSLNDNYIEEDNVINNNTNIYMDDISKLIREDNSVIKDIDFNLVDDDMLDIILDETKIYNFRFNNNYFLRGNKYPKILSNSYKFMRYVIDMDINNIAYIDIYNVDSYNLKKIIDYTFRKIYFLQREGNDITLDINGIFKDSDIINNDYFKECLRYIRIS